MVGVNGMGWPASPKQTAFNDGEARWIPPLPALLHTVVPPQTFSPSHIGLADECLLRAVLGSARPVESLPAHPAADIGTAFHLLLERAVRGEIERRGSPEDDARRELDTLLDEASLRFGQRMPPGVPKDLRAVWPPLKWRRKVRLVLDVAVRYLEQDSQNVQQGTAAVSDGALASSPADSGTVPDFDALSEVGIWAEVRMRAPELRIAGRADLVEKTPASITIRDLKTGRATEEDGTVRTHVARQLRMYGLMARRRLPETPVRLVVDDGSEREIVFGATEEAEVESWLRAAVSPVPNGVAVAADGIATVGPACEGCGFRHVCPAYRRSAPSMWRDGASHRLPLDIWGRVEDVATDTRGSARVRMRDDAGRLVAISGLAGARAEGIRVNSSLFLFGLRTRDRTGGRESWRHPLNFFEGTPDDPYDRAWAIAAFRATAGP